MSFNDSCHIRPDILFKHGRINRKVIQNHCRPSVQVKVGRIIQKLQIRLLNKIGSEILKNHYTSALFLWRKLEQRWVIQVDYCYLIPHTKMTILQEFRYHRSIVEKGYDTRCTRLHSLYPVVEILIKHQ